MNTFDGVLGLQVESLTDALRHRQESRCREIVSAAEHQAKDAVAEARRESFRRRRQAVSEARQRRQQELHVASSRIESRARLKALGRHGRVIEAAWPKLVDALHERWANDDERKAWCEMIATEAARVLAGAAWVVEHPGNWPGRDRDAVVALAVSHGLPKPEFRADEDIEAGLRIHSGPASVDGTIAGLLAARPQIEALLLAAWEEQQEAGND